VKCPFCQNKVSIVNYDEETGKIETLYYRVECKLGCKDAVTQCEIKKFTDFLIDVKDEIYRALYDAVSGLVSEITDVIISAINPIVEFIIGAGACEKEIHPPATTPQRQYNIVPRAKMRMHRVQKRR
jgi:hypothetical protein